MQQNILLYSEAKTARPFWWSSLDFWVVWAFSRLTTSEDWPFRPLRGLKGQISGLSASLRPGQPRNLARQPKKSCCFSSLYNKIPFLIILIKCQITHYIVHHDILKIKITLLSKLTLLVWNHFSIFMYPSGTITFNLYILGKLFCLERKYFFLKY